MGCWGFGIMQSDDALDAELEIYEKLHVKYGEKDTPIHLEKHWQEIQNYCNASMQIEPYDVAVAWQMLCIIVMRHGAVVTPDQQKEILSGIQICPEYQDATKYENDLTQYVKDKVASGEMEIFRSVDEAVERMRMRKLAINDLCHEFKSYINSNFQPFEHKDVGLMETIHRKMKNN